MFIKYKNKMLYFYLILICMIMFITHVKSYNALDDFIDWNVMIYNLKNGYFINMIPFRTIITYIQDTLRLQIYHFVYIMLGNIVIFIPIGIFLSKSNLKMIILFVILKEIIQFVFNVGSFDIDTMILNYIGILLGMSIQKIYFKYKIKKI